MNSEHGEKHVLATVGGLAAMVSVAFLVADICIGTVLGGDLSRLPSTAAGRFAQFAQSPWLGLYNLDLLNSFNAVITVPVFFAVLSVHKAREDWLRFGVLVYLLGTAVLLASNAALPMLDLSARWAAASSDAQRAALEAAGESLLARGAHGSPGVFPGFFLSALAPVVISIGMLRGGLFGKVPSSFGIAGGSLLSIYLVVVTFVPGAKNAAVALAAPGGLLSIAWTIMIAVKLLKPARAAL